MEKNLKKDIYVWITESLYCTPETNILSRFKCELRSLVTLLQLNCDPDPEQCLPCSGVCTRAAWRGAGLRNDPVSESAATGPGVVVLVILSYWGFVSCQ